VYLSLVQYRGGPSARLAYPRSKSHSVFPVHSFNFEPSPGGLSLQQHQDRADAYQPEEQAATIAIETTYRNRAERPGRPKRCPEAHLFFPTAADESYGTRSVTRLRGTAIFDSQSLSSKREWRWNLLGDPRTSRFVEMCDRCRLSLSLSLPLSPRPLHPIIPSGSDLIMMSSKFGFLTAGTGNPRQVQLHARTRQEEEDAGGG